MKRWKGILAAAVFVLAAVLAGCSPTVPSSHEFFPVNEAGLSYGIGYDEAAQTRYIEKYGQPETQEEFELFYAATTPELVAVIGDNGEEGYVLSRELMLVPSSPKKALEFMEEWSETGQKLDVYDAETMAIIDSYTAQWGSEWG